MQNVLYVSKRFGKLTLDLVQAFKDNLFLTSLYKESLQDYSELITMEIQLELMKIQSLQSSNTWYLHDGLHM